MGTEVTYLSFLFALGVFLGGCGLFIVGVFISELVQNYWIKQYGVLTAYYLAEASWYKNILNVPAFVGCLMIIISTFYAFFAIIQTSIIATGAVSGNLLPLLPIFF